MKTLRILVLAAVVAQTGAASAAEPITPDTTIFTVIDHIEGDRLTLRMLHSVMSRNAETILFVGDEVRATLEPLSPGRTRHNLCVTAILGREGVGRIVEGTKLSSSSAYPGCLAQVHDFRGAAGLPAGQIAIDMVTTIMLNGDLVLDHGKR